MHPAPSSDDSTQDLLVKSREKKVTPTGVSAPHLRGNSLIDHPVGHAFANHDSCAVSFGPNAIRHDRRAGNPRPLDPTYPAVLVYHGYLVGVRTDLAGAGQLLPDPHVFQKLLVQRVVGSQVCFHRRNKLLYDDIEGLMLHHV